MFGLKGANIDKSSTFYFKEIESRRHGGSDLSALPYAFLSRANKLSIFRNVITGMR